jgi:hypothetical protein
VTVQLQPEGTKPESRKRKKETGANLLGAKPLA